MFVFLYFLAIPPINTTALNKNSTSLHFLLLTTPPISKEKERLLKNNNPITLFMTITSLSISISFRQIRCFSHAITYMHDCKIRIFEHNLRTAFSHHFFYLCFHIWFVAMDFAILTSWFFLLKRTFAQTKICIVLQLLTLFT